MTRRKKGGAALLAAGGVLAVIGVALLRHASALTPEQGQYAAAVPAIFFAAMSTLAATAGVNRLATVEPEQADG